MNDIPLVELVELIIESRNRQIALLSTLRTSHDELLVALKWFINDIDGTHKVMLDFYANVIRAREAIAMAEQV